MYLGNVEVRQGFLAHGVVVAVDEKKSKAGNDFAIVTLNYGRGVTELMVMDKVQVSQFKDLLGVDVIMATEVGPRVGGRGGVSCMPREGDRPLPIDKLVLFEDAPPLSINGPSVKAA